MLLTFRSISAVWSTDMSRREKKTANRIKKLKAIFLELSFPAALTDLAYQTRHLSVPNLVRELSKIKHKNIPVYLHHLKPIYYDKIRAEVMALGLKQLHILKPKTTLTI